MNKFERQRNILDFTLSALLRRKRKNAALAFVYMFVVFMLASALFFTRALKQEAAIVLGKAPDIVVQRIVAGRQAAVPASYQEAIRAVPGVAGLKGRLWGYYYDTVFGGANYTLLVPDDFPYSPGTVAVGSGVARNSGSVEDNILPFRSHDGTLTTLVIGQILPPESELVTSDLVLLSEEDFRGLFGIAKAFSTDLVVSVQDPKELAVVAGRIARLLPDAKPVTRDDILRTYDEAFDWRGGILLVLLTGAAAAFVIFAWDRASGLSAEERREIGILKAIGWETSDVLWVKIWEGITLSLASSLAGILLAYVHVFFASAALFGPVLRGWSVLVPQFRLVPFVSAAEVAILLCAAVVPYTAATVVPAWRAAAVDPDAVMRT